VQGAHAPVGDKNDIAAPSAVSAVRAAVGHVFFRMKRHRAVAAVACFDMDAGMINEHRLPPTILMRRQKGPA
jgi:hypothetical protein